MGLRLSAIGFATLCYNVTCIDTYLYYYDIELVSGDAEALWLENL